MLGREGSGLSGGGLRGGSGLGGGGLTGGFMIFGSSFFLGNCDSNGFAMERSPDSSWLKVNWLSCA